VAKREGKGLKISYAARFKADRTGIGRWWLDCQFRGTNQLPFPRNVKWNKELFAELMNSKIKD